MLSFMGKTYRNKLNPLPYDFSPTSAEAKMAVNRKQEKHKH